MPPKQLTVTPALTLVQPELHYSEQLFQLIDTSRPLLEPWMGWVKQIRTPKEVHHFLFDAIRFNEGQQRCTFLVRSGQELAGLVSLVKIEWGHHRAELGYWFGAGFQGRGLATQSCRRLLDFAFGELCLNRVAIRTSAENKRSVALAKRLGFSVEGRLREALLRKGKYQHLVVLGMLNREWKHEKF